LLLRCIIASTEVSVCAGRGDPGREGLSTDGAKLRFVQAYGKAMAEERNKTNFRAY
jgi:hypothetical protein